MATLRHGKKKLNQLETEAFVKHHSQSRELFAPCPRRLFFEPCSPAQQLYEALPWLWTGKDDYSKPDFVIVHLNGQAARLA